MSEASFASLEPALLARKGGAKPAMRPQLTPLPDTDEVGAMIDEQLEDLGWNDMGDDGNEGPVTLAPREAEMSDEPVSNIVALTRPGAGRNADGYSNGPIVLHKQPSGAQSDGTARNLAAAAMPLQASDDDDEPLVKRKPANNNFTAAAKARQTRRASFTLRLDQDRHLKLRLAATMRDISAQAVATEALDLLFAKIDDLDSIAARIRPN